MQCNKISKGSVNNICAPKIIFDVIKRLSRKTLLFTTTLVILFPFLFPPFCSIHQIFQYCDRSIRFSIALWKSIDLNHFASTFKLFLCFFSLLLSLQFSILCIHVPLGENCSFYIIWKSNNFIVSKSEGLYIDMSIADK